MRLSTYSLREQARRVLTLIAKLSVVQINIISYLRCIIITRRKNIAVRIHCPFQPTIKGPLEVKKLSLE